MSDFNTSLPGFVQAGVIDAAGQVIGDVTCRKCAYNLHSLSISGRCPECGTSVGFSIQGDYLRYCDPVWVDTLRRGVVTILSGIGVIVLGVIVQAALSATARQNAPKDGLRLVVVTLGYLIMVAGAWLLTTPDPSGLGEDRYGRARRLIRITLAIGVAYQILSLGIRPQSLSQELFIPLIALQTVLAFVGLAGQIAMLRYLSQLSLRIPDDRLAGRANVLMWGIGMSYGLFLALSFALVLSATVGGFRSIPSLGTIGCVGSILGLALLIFGVMYLFMLDRLRRALQDQADIARSTWAAANPDAAP